MKHLKLLILFILVNAYAFGQGNPPSGTKQLSTNQGYINPVDSTIWWRISATGVPSFYYQGVRFNEMRDSLKKFSTSVNVESFRKPGLTDDKIIQDAIDYGGKGSLIVLGSNIVYNIVNSLLLDSNQALIGKKSVLKRGNSIFTTLSSSAGASSNSITVTSVPNGWKPGDQLQLYTDTTASKSSSLNLRILSIAGNVISLSRPVNSSVDGTITVWPMGAYVRKIYSLISSKHLLDSVNAPFSVHGVIFQGNKENNNQNYYWYANPAVVIRGFQSVISNCYFFDSPNETIVSQGAHVIGNFAYNINGSFVHISGQADIETHAFEQENMYIQNNYVNNSNIISTLITGHSEGVITNSFNGGNATITGNRFFNGGEAVLGAFSTSSLPAHIGVGRLVYADNYAENFDQIIYEFSGGSGSIEGSVTFNGGEFNNCGINDWSSAAYYGISGQSMKLSGNTTIVNSSAPITYISKDDNIVLNKLTKSGNPTETFSFVATGKSSGNIVALGADLAGNPVMQGYDSTFTTPKQTFINPYGGNVWFGDGIDDGTGSKYQFFGSLSLSGRLSQGTRVLSFYPGNVSNISLYESGSTKYGFGVHGNDGSLDISANQDEGNIRFFSGSDNTSPTVRAIITRYGNLLINTTTESGDKLQVNGSTISAQYKLSSLNTAPSSASDTGVAGEIRITSTHIYVCTATNTWVRSALSTW
ncbi:hypothetical protein [Pedobacter africanus]|uniref:Right handed beta helix region n=1 Tax=Pedobacter africanus TaxID=151894 RepID=A0A1W1ZBC9_9SPHI|nr:hypothetical protein [Pedobacter africanus]SMC45646.1 hypothetical protein SAMN04488524_0555 [Pedobacter africanus]